MILRLFVSIVTAALFFWGLALVALSHYIRDFNQREGDGEAQKLAALGLILEILGALTFFIHNKG